MEKVYMVCDYADNAAVTADRPLNVCVGHTGNCGGRILREDGTQIGRHHSSSFGWLRLDLLRGLEDPSKYEVIDLIGLPVPDRFKFRGESNNG